MKKLNKNAKIWILSGALLGFLFWPVAFPADATGSRDCISTYPHCGFTTVPRVQYMLTEPGSYYGFALQPFTSQFFVSYDHATPIDYCSTKVPLACLIEYVSIPLSTIGGGVAGWFIFKFWFQKRSKQIQ